MHPTSSSPAARPTDADLDRLARRRAGAKLGWFVHAGIYAAVNLVLTAISLRGGHGWAIYPALGWGVGLLAHGAAVWLALPGSGAHARLVARERAALQRHAGR